MPTASTFPTPASLPIRPRLRLSYLDGLRGLAALYVTVHHATVGMPLLLGQHWSRTAERLLRPLAFGHLAVDVFIVLSGYCLMLPVVQNGGVVRGGAMRFLGRRARRILPPYFAALALSLLLIGARMQGPDTLHFAFDRTAWEPAVLLSHLLLLHNLSPHWIYGINVPMWSVATEGQIYPFLPLLLLPLWKNAGAFLMVLAAFAIGLAPHFLLPPGHNADGACFWFLGLFALGAAVAPHALAPQTRTRWGLLTLGAGLLTCGALLLPHWGVSHPFVVDPLVGLTVALFLGWATQQVNENSKPSFLVRLLEGRAMLRLGEFSYSLYLIHYPLLLCFWGALRLTSLAPDVRLLLLLFVWTPLCLLCAYGFHLVFERRFMSPVARAAERGLPPKAFIARETL